MNTTDISHEQFKNVISDQKQIEEINWRNREK